VAGLELEALQHRPQPARLLDQRRPGRRLHQLVQLRATAPLPRLCQLCTHLAHGRWRRARGGAQMVTVDLQARCSNNLLRNFDRKLNLPEFDCTQQPRETLAAQFHGGRAPGVAGWRTSLMACSTVASSVIGAGGGRGPRGHTPYGSPAPRLGDRTPRWPRAATPGHAPPPLPSCGAS